MMTSGSAREKFEVV